MIWVVFPALLLLYVITEYAIATGVKPRLDHQRELLGSLAIIAFLVTAAVLEIEKAIKEHTDAVTTALRNHGSAGTLAGPDDDTPRPGK